MTARTLLASLLLLLIGAGLVTAASAQDISAYRWKKRVVVAFASTRTDPRLLRQRREMAALTGRSDDRDLVFIPAVGRGCAALRRKLGAPADGFEAVLVGKDGHVADRSREPFTGEHLARLIDSMPMRQDEMKRRR